MSDNRTVLITGCSSGIGYASAKLLKEKGFRVFATVRKDADLIRLESEGFETFRLDYTDPITISECVAEVAELSRGKLYGLFNNGAYGQPGALEDISRAALTAQFEANVFGWHELTRDCLKLMRANGGGRIVNNSSVLGLTAMKWRGAYCATKFAIEAMSDTLRLELQGTNIHVSLIEPGPIATRFVEHAMAAFDRNVDETMSHYREAYVKQRQRLNGGGAKRFKLPPEAVALKLLHALESRKPKRRYYVTVPTYVMAWARRLLPPPALDRLLDKASDQ
ncbi:SDR family oxidoreductase [Taklimakanibacter albus]|uniref:SDR family oxidoreductase n=1 Tax=Taklimakanibacter albus TaxID=2800327 RepID=A0ACC5QX28_9HYPH|nr:SDR family oxidoreductase [Aestuariivirga sp. YIM B02566]MBK1864915.1 SDR family oxidoreductase [Aestuariivirga sp. YIM B02566]